MTKKRTDNQKLEMRSRHRLKEQLLHFVVNDLHEDFGLDFEVRFTESKREGPEEISPVSFYIQLKASEEFEGNESEIRYSLGIDFIETFWFSTVPVLLVFYSKKKDEFYYRVLQEFRRNDLENSKKVWEDQDTVKISVPKSNKITAKNDFERQIAQSALRILQDRTIGPGVDKAIRKKRSTKRLSKLRKSSAVKSEYYTIKKAESECEDGNKKIARSLLSELSDMYESRDLFFGEDIIVDELITSRIQQTGRAIELARKVGDESIRDHFESHSDRLIRVVKNSLVGNAYFNTECGEEFIILSTDFVVGGMFPMVLVQYEDGTFYDHGFHAIVGPGTFPQVEPDATSDVKVEDICDEGTHTFNKQSENGSRTAFFCTKCGWSMGVLMEITNHSVPPVCEGCGEIIENSVFEGGIPVCEECSTDD
jgi:hypothetical protein